MTLTIKQRDILRAIRDFRMTEGVAPTIGEVADSLGVSKVTAWEKIQALKKQGLIRFEKYKARSMSVTELGKTAIEPFCCPHCRAEIRH